MYKTQVYINNHRERGIESYYWNVMFWR